MSKKFRMLISVVLTVILAFSAALPAFAVRTAEVDLPIVYVKGAGREIYSADGTMIMPFEIASFTDLPTEHWAFESIVKCVDEKFLLGYPDGTFAPDKGLTRAELAVIIYRLLKGK